MKLALIIGMKTSVTMADVARTVGVSASTVSRALRNDSRISQAMRQEIRQVAESMHYRPNPLVSALMSNRNAHFDKAAMNTIALVTDYVGKESWKTKDVCRWEYEGMIERADALGYKVEEFALSDYSEDPERLSQVIRNRGIHGVLLGFSRDRRNKALIATGDFAIAGLSAYFRDALVDRSNFHGMYNVRLALDEIRKLGYRKTGLVVPEFNNRISGWQWSAGALDWQRHLPSADRCQPFIPAQDDSRATFAQWMQREQPDSLLVYKLPVQTWLASMGLTVPADIGVAYLYRTQTEMEAGAGIDGNLQLVGAASVDLVVASLNLNQVGLPRSPKEVLVKGVWRSGSTLRDKYKASSNLSARA